MPHDDEHWVDNVRVAAQPAKPAPPLLVNATTEALTLSWVPPHHGGEPIDLYRLRLLRASRCALPRGARRRRFAFRRCFWETT